MMSEEPYWSVTCENKFAEFNCSYANKVLNIISALYGIFGEDRRDRCYNESTSIRTINCRSLWVTETFRSLCDNKPSCSIRAHHGTLNIPDPCEGYKKFLEVSYECIAGPSTTTSTTTTERITTTNQVSTSTEHPTSQTTKSISTDRPIEATPVITTAFSAGNQTSTPTDTTDSLPLEPGVIAGIVVGGLVFLIIALLCFAILWKRRRRNKTPQDGAEVKKNEIYEMNGGYDASSPGPDDSNEYAFADDKPNHVTTPSNQQPDNAYSYADESNPADTKQGTMTVNILYETQG